jgi:hypothetical protein
MMLLALLAPFAIGGEPEHFRVGPWEGYCESGTPEACTRYIAYTSGPVWTLFDRSAGGIGVMTKVADCQMRGFRNLWSAMLDPSPTAAATTRLIREDIEGALGDCQSKLAAPEILEADIDALLRRTADVRPAK